MRGSAMGTATSWTRMGRSSSAAAATGRILSLPTSIRAESIRRGESDARRSAPASSGGRCWRPFPMMSRPLCLTGIVLLLVLGTGRRIPGSEVNAMQNPPPSVENESQEHRDARMRWWREAKFGLLIHWGVYAVPAGTWKGEQIPGIGEWIMLRGTIPVADYRQFARQFNHVRYDPEAWAALAQEAGLKYVVITSQHHDGVALCDSQVTDWDIAAA